MEFLTLHELSLQLDVSVRVLRHRLRQLLLDGKLIENQDCRRDDYVDETHFVWRVNPLAFLRATGLRVVTQPANQPLPPVNPSASPVSQPVNQSTTQPASSVTHVAAPVTQAPPPMEARPPGIEREMLDLLKDQIHAKDGQIADLSDQNKKLNDMNLKLVGQTVQQSDRIQTLLRLTEGKMDLADAVIHVDNQPATAATQPVNQTGATDDQVGNHAPHSFRDQGSGIAA